MVRCGVAIYGLDPFGADPAEQGLEPALELRSYVADVKRFEPGDSAGYGRTLDAPPSRPGSGCCRSATATASGAALSNNAEVLIGGRRYPLVGTISMDNVTVDLGPEPQVEPGDAAVLIGAQGGERILARSWRGGWRRSTTRSPAGSRRGCRAAARSAAR